MNGSSTKVLDELNLTQRVTGSGRNGEHTQLLGAILETQTACEHAIAAGVLEYVIRAQTNHPQVTSHLIGPLVEVFLGVKDNGGVTRGA